MSTRTRLSLCSLLLAATVLASSAASAALSIASSPLFLTITLPPNLTVLLDDSGSLQWAHAPDADGSTGNGTVFANGVPATATTTTTTVLSTCTHSHAGNCTNYAYSCPTGYTLHGSSSGTTSTAPSGTTCQGATTYSCPAGTTSSGTGSSMICGGYQAVSGVYIPDTNHYKSAAFNPLAYNPSVAYAAPYNSSGTQLTTSFTAAYVNGYDTALGTVNLSTSYEATVDYNPSTTATTLMGSTSHNAFNVSDEVNSCNGNFTVSGGSVSCQTVHTPQPAFYYVYKSSNTGCTASLTDDRCYNKVVVSTTSSPSGGDETQNFANWFSFYRTRNLTVATSADIAFNSINQNYRVAWIDLHTCPTFSSSTCKGWDSTATAVDNRIGQFTGQHRTDFFNWLSRFPANNGTPLRAQLETIGTYYTTSGVDSPYAYTPHTTDAPEYVCRPNYAVVMTDGEWNEATSSLTVQPGNLDNSTVTLPDGTAYPPASPSSSHPYSDSNSNTLADVAFYYWSTNLRPDLGTSTALEYTPYGKNVAVKDSVGNITNLTSYWNPQNDPAQWPHMVTFTIGLGLSTDLASPPTWQGSSFIGGYNDLVTGHVAWPTAFSCGDASGSCTDPIGNVYDLWHAAIDSRGEFFAADQPQEVISAFNTIFTRIQGRIGSSSAVAVNSTRLDSNTLIYQAQFNSSDWTGEVIAYPINTNGSIASYKWKASTLIPAAASRNIFTWSDSANSGAGGGVSFAWTNLSTSEQGYLNNNIYGSPDANGSLRVNYLRGDQTNEQNNGGIFRTRDSILGDIVDSNPFYVGTQDYGFDVLAEGSTIPTGQVVTVYDQFVANKANRSPVLYVGANDGMLHAFNANTGVEMFTFIPHGVYPNLSALTDPTYVHQYYVDGSPQSVDAYFGSTPAWHTVLAGTTGAGAREVYLLDITTPDTEAAANVLYDYDGAAKSDNDMGYTIGVATVARMNDGNWWMIWGNGYNSPNGHAVLYMYNLNSGGAPLKFDTGVGGGTVNNGMSSPAPIDLTGDRIADAIYAGDLQGNLWKLDVSSTQSSKWGYVSYGKSGSAPLFAAKDASGNIQPITVRPQVGLDSKGRVMVLFGTGTYFQTNDNTVPATPPVQSFYGIIDDKGTASTDQVLRANLLRQYIVTQVTINGSNFRVSTNYQMATSNQGWYMDLSYPSAQGERVVSDAEIDNGRIIFTTLIPQSAACQFGGTSFLMELNLDNGGQISGTSPFDTNGDGKVNSSDYTTVSYTDPATGKNVTVTVPVSGVQSTVGIIKTPGIISAGDLQYKYYSGSTGAVGMTVESNPTTGGRLSWQQLPNQ